MDKSNSVENLKKTSLTPKKSKDNFSPSTT